MSAQAAAKAVGQAAKAAGESGSKQVLHKGAKRDPELYVHPPSPRRHILLYHLSTGC